MTETRYIDIKHLKLLENNPRKISKDQMDKLKKSLDSDPLFLDARPVLVNQVDGNYFVYAGNQRVTAAKKLGWKQIKCHIDNDIPEETIKRRIIADNAHFGTWDFDILANEFDLPTLLDCGLTEDMLHLNLELDEPAKPKAKKLKECPNCGHSF
jgi:ParB-like chromosome segregation protein Spo0J